MTANKPIFFWKMLISLPKQVTNSTGNIQSSKFKALQTKHKRYVIGFKYVKENHLLFFEGGDIANVSFWM